MDMSGTWTHDREHVLAHVLPHARTYDNDESDTGINSRRDEPLRSARAGKMFLDLSEK